MKLNPLTGKFEFDAADLLRQPGDGTMDPAVVSTGSTPTAGGTAKAKTTEEVLASLDPNKDYTPPTPARRAEPMFQQAQAIIAANDTSDEIETPVKAGAVVGQDPAAILGAYRNLKATPESEELSLEDADTEKIRTKQSILDQFRELTKKRDRNNQILDYFDAGSLIGDAFAQQSGHKGLSDKTIEMNKQLRQRNEQPIADLSNAQKLQSDEAKLQQLVEKTNPQSELASLQRSVVSKLADELGVKVGDLNNTSAENLNEIMRSLSYIQSNKNTAEARKESARLQELLMREKMAATAATTAQNAENKKIEQERKAEKDLNDQMQKIEKSVNDAELISKNNAINSINDYLTKNYKVNLNTSENNTPDIPGVGMFGGLRPDLLTSSKDISFRKEVAGLANALLKSRSGAAVTDPEYKRFLEEASSDRFSNESEMLSGLRKMQKDIVAQNNLVLNKFGDKTKEEFLSRTNLPTLNYVDNQETTSPAKQAPTAPPNSTIREVGGKKYYFDITTRQNLGEVK